MDREPERLDLFGQRTSEAILDWLSRQLGTAYVVMFGDPPDEDHSMLVVSGAGRTIMVSIDNAVIWRPTRAALMAVVKQVQQALDAAD